MPSPRPRKREATAQPWVASAIENGQASPVFFSIGESRQAIKKNSNIPRISGEARTPVVSHDEQIKLNIKKFHELIRKGDIKDFSGAYSFA